MESDAQREKEVEQVEWPDKDRTVKSRDARQVWICDDCAVIVPVWSPDPYYPGEVYCPDCLEPMEHGRAEDA